MDLIDEEQRALPSPAASARLLEQAFQVGDPREDGRNRDEIELRPAGQESRHRGLAGTGRPPEDQGSRGAAGEQPRQSAVRPDKVLLSRHLVEKLRPQAVGQRPLGGDFPDA